jgi:hypothetical protein
MSLPEQTPLEELLSLVKKMDEKNSQFQIDIKKQMEAISNRLDVIEGDKSFSTAKVRNHKDVNKVLKGMLKYIRNCCVTTRSNTYLYLFIYFSSKHKN